jgi:hypothetical protein
MPYYQGDYYRGDYYQGGIFDVFKRVAGTVVGSLPVVGTAYRAVSTARNIISPSRPRTPSRTAGIPRITGGVGPPIGSRGPYTPAMEQADRALMEAQITGKYKKSRRMNVTNPKALRRAIRRQAGFVKLAKKALKGTGYTIVSRGSRRPRTVVKESGPGSVTVQ